MKTIKYKNISISKDELKSFFSNKINCNVFDINSTVLIGKQGNLPQMNIDIDCKLNKYNDVDLLLNNLSDCFTFYYIYKCDKKEIINLHATIRYNTSDCLLDNKFLPKSNSFSESFCVMNNGFNFNENDLIKIAGHKYNREIGEASFITIKDFDSIQVDDDEKKYCLNFSELK